jgi:dienelactone hydrolase
MAEILLFHHALGRTPGVLGFAQALRDAGHVVHVPDLYEGRSFASIVDGVGHAQDIGFEEIVARGMRAAQALPAGLVYAGWSLGVLPAQKLAQTRPGARGALLLEACVPPATFGAHWPAGVALQVHGMDEDALFAGEGDLEAARALTAAVPGAALWLYPGDGHLFADPGSPAHEPAAAALLLERVLAFLARC